MEMNFCRRCGQTLKQAEHGYVCGNGHHIFANPSPAMGVLLVNDRREVLLAVRGIEPAKGMLDMPGGFCELGETLEETAARELQEELGLSRDDYGPLNYVMSLTDPYDFDGETTTAVGVTYWAKLKPGAKITPGDDVVDTVTVAAKDIDFDRIAFKGEGTALRRLIELGII